MKHKQVFTADPLAVRAVVALEKISICLAGILDCFLAITDGNDKSLRMKDIKRAEVYKTHLGEKLK